VSSHNPDLWFGIEADGARSKCWRVRAGARKPEVFIEPEGLGQAMHVSLHASGRWHVKVQGNPVHAWPRPDEFHPGLVRALVIVQSLAMTVVTTPPPRGTVLAHLPVGDDPMNFNVWIEQPGANLAGWPGKNRPGTKLVGRLGLANGAGSCVVTSHVQTVGAATMAIDPSGQELAGMKQAADAGALYATLISEEAGTVWFRDGKFKPF
jgi:hypothetical protein